MRCQPANAHPSAANASSQPAPSSARGSPARMPGSQTLERRRQHPGADRPSPRSAELPSARSAACRRSSARSASSARRRSASICERSSSMRALSRSNASFSAATTHAGQPRLERRRAGRSTHRADGISARRPAEPPGQLRQTADRVEHTHPLGDTHHLSLWTDAGGSSTAALGRANGAREVKKKIQKKKTSPVFRRR